MLGICIFLIVFPGLLGLSAGANWIYDQMKRKKLSAVAKQTESTQNVGYIQDTPKEA